MASPKNPLAARRHPVVRWLVRLAVAVVAIGLLIPIGFTVYAVAMLPPLQRWHTEQLPGEFSAERDAELDFDGYLRREALLFDALRAAVASWDKGDEAFAHSRFNQAGALNRLADGAPYNRSFRLAAPKAVGQALLVHGLTDSPYSMKALALALHQRGFDVTVLRLPGHGTLPSMMTAMSARDWIAAVRIAARDVGARAAAGQPFYVGGYSTGGTLALQYTLEALADPALRRPDRVLLVSPAIEVTPVAVVTEFLDVFSTLPVLLLQKARWQEILPEYDPYKYNSFAVNATRQVYHATRSLQDALADASASGALARMPPVVAWQSVVDSTVGATGVADILYARLQGPQHRLVLFDVNRHQVLGSVLRPASKEFLERLARGPRGYTLDTVANLNPRDGRVAVQRLAPDGAHTLRESALVWPAGLVSLGHVALPFGPDDPVYGFVPGSGRDGVPSIGSWLLRGESGALTISLGSLTRLRSNPFWALVDEEVGALVAADLAQGRR